MADTTHHRADRRRLITAIAVLALVVAMAAVGLSLTGLADLLQPAIVPTPAP